MRNAGANNAGNAHTWGSVPDLASAILALGAVVVSVFSLVIAMRADGRQAQQVDQQFANKVYLGEATPSLYTKHPKRVNPAGREVISRWVFNVSGIEITNVWVRSVDDKWIRIGGIQRCTAYSVPADFVAQDLYFTDPIGKWHKTWGGASVRQDDYGRTPDMADDADSEFDEPIEGCAG